MVARGRYLCVVIILRTQKFGVVCDIKVKPIRMRADDTLMLFIIIIIIISFSFEGRVRESGPAGRTTSLYDGGGGSIVAVQL